MKLSMLCYSLASTNFRWHEIRRGNHHFWGLSIAFLGNQWCRGAALQFSALLRMGWPPEMPRYTWLWDTGENTLRCIMAKDQHWLHSKITWMIIILYTYIYMIIYIYIHTHVIMDDYGWFPYLFPLFSYPQISKHCKKITDVNSFQGWPCWRYWRWRGATAGLPWPSLTVRSPRKAMFRVFRMIETWNLFQDWQRIRWSSSYKAQSMFQD